MIYAVIHRGGCGLVACYVTSPIRDGDLIGHMLHLDGRPVITDDGLGTIGELVRCEACQALLNPQHFDVANCLAL